MMVSTLWRSAALVVALGGSLATFVACSESPASAPYDPPMEDAGEDASGDAGPTRDAEASSPADADAGEVATCTDEGWCHTVLPPDQVLRGVWPDGQGDAWAVTEQGNILRYADDTKSWSIQHALGDTHPLRTIWGSGPTDLWVGGVKALFHGTGATPSAITWTEVPLDGITGGGASVTGEAVLSIYGTRPSDLYAVTAAELLRYTSAGWTIEPVLVEGKKPAFTAVWGGEGRNDIWVSSSFPGIPERDWMPPPEVATLMHRVSPPEAATTQWEYTIKASDEVTIPSADCDRAGPPLRGTMVGDREIWLIATRRQFISETYCRYYFHGIMEDSSGYTFEGSPLYDARLKHNDIWGLSKDDIWSTGDHGTLQHWDGKSWSLAAIAVTHLPVLSDFYALGGRGGKELWAVGDRIALHKTFP